MSLPVPQPGCQAGESKRNLIVTHRSRRVPRGRVVLLTALGISAIMQLTASVLLDYRWPQLRFPAYHAQLARLASVPSPSIVFLGSSRSACGLDEALINREAQAASGDEALRCFNASVPAGDPIVCERVLGDLLARGVRPRFAVIEISPEGINHRNGWLGRYVLQFPCWHDTPAHFKDLLLTGTALRFAGTRFVPLYMYRETIRQQLTILADDLWHGRLPGTGPAPMAEYGFTPGSARKAQTILAAYHRSQKRSAATITMLDIEDAERSLRDYRPGGNAAASLDRLLTRCRANGIEPILLTVPLSSAHRRLYTSAIEAAYHAHMNALARKHGCRYFDYRDALPDEMFLDHHHVGIEGSEQFSRRLATEVLVPMWQAKPLAAHIKRHGLPDVCRLLFNGNECSFAD